MLFYTPKFTYANTVVLNELMANPTDNTEWVELYNPTNQAIDLSNWKLKDGNSLTRDDLTLSGQINSFSFITFNHDKGWLNDTGDETITLLDNTGQIVDNYQYSGTTKGKTYGRQPDGLNWQSNLEPSKGSSNGEPLPIPSPTPSPTLLPSPISTPSTSPSISKTKSTTSVSSSPSPTPSAHVTPSPSPQRLVTTTTVPKTKSQIAAVAARASATPSVEVKSEKRPNYIPWIGLVLVVCGIGSLIYIYLSRKKLP